MSLPTWTKENLDYTRKLVHSAVEGAQSGEEVFLHGEPFERFFGSSVRSALRPAAIGAVVGIVGSCSQRRHPAKALAYGVVGATIGFGVGLAWASRLLMISVADCAWKNVGQVRDEHWFEQNPIDYA